MSDGTRPIPGLHPVRELLRSSQDVHSLHVDSEREPTPVLDEIRQLAGQRRIPLHDTGPDELTELAAGVHHQGVVAVAPSFPYRDVDDILASVPSGEATLLVALDGITDPHNVGSVARTAEAVGAHGMLVPKRRAAGVTPAGEKAAAGALAHLPVARVTNLTRTLNLLAEAGVWSVGLDAAGEVAVDACDLLVEPVVIVVGSEGTGLSRLVAETCDQRASLPIRGRVESLNASVAAAVTLFLARFGRDRA